MTTVDPVEAGFPTMAGVIFRRLNRPTDDGVVSGLLNAALVADELPHRISAAQIASWLDHPSRMDPAKDWLMAEADGKLIGYCEGGWEQDNDGGRNYGVWGQVDPSWRRRGLGTLLLHWIEARQRTVAASHPPEVEKRFESWTHEAEIGRLALLESNGYTVARYEFEMERDHLDDIPDFPFPDDVELRPATEEH
ncbi:MAG: GNAT family N-acetyltransferase, partial [Acidimicrobiia bacterium]|nr:GNAT family N-acetyltransferase [Acidimicrobiia bacterium]